MNKHLRYVGDQAECNKLAGQGVAFANTVAQQMLSLGIENMEREFYLSPESHIRVKCNKESAIITIYAEPKGYSMKSGLIRSGKIVSGSNGKLAAKDFRDSEYAFQMKHDAWVSAGSQGVEPVREYYNVEDLSFIKEVNDYGHGYPIPSRYTGLMATAIEFAIGANRIVDTSHGWFQTDGIYRDGDTDWMVRINPTGAWARKVQKLSGDLFPGYEDKINSSTLGYVPKELRFPTGDKYIEDVNNGSIIKLSGSVSEFYDSCWSADKGNNQGWCFNSTGNSACNISIKNWRAVNSPKKLNVSRVVVASISISSSSNTGSISLSVSEQSEVTTLVIPYGAGGPCGPIIQYSGFDDFFGDDLKLETGGGFWDLNMYNAGGSLYLVNGVGWYDGGSGINGHHEFPVWCAYIGDAIVTGRIGYENRTANSDQFVQGAPFPATTPDGVNVYNVAQNGSWYGGTYAKSSYAIRNGVFRYTATVGGSPKQTQPEPATLMRCPSGGVVASGYFEIPDFYATDTGPYWNPHDPYMYAIGNCWWKVEGGNEPTTTNTYKTTSHSKISVSMSHTDRLAFFIKCPSISIDTSYSEGSVYYCHRGWLPSGAVAFYPQYDTSPPDPAICNWHAVNCRWVAGTYSGAGGYARGSSALPSTWARKWRQGTDPNDCWDVIGSFEYSDGPSIDYTSTMECALYNAYTPGQYTNYANDLGGDTPKSYTIPAGRETHSIKKMQNIMYINGNMYTRETPNDAAQVEIRIPGFGPYRYLDGLQFVSYRCSQNESKIATNYFMANGNMDSGSENPNSIHLVEESVDGEVYVDWYLKPETIPNGVSPKRCNFVGLSVSAMANAEPGSPQYDEAVRQYELRETVNRQFFGPYIWCGPQ